MTNKLHVDGTIAAANRAAELQVENERLRTLLDNAPRTTPTGYSRRQLWEAWKEGRMSASSPVPALQSFNEWLFGPMGAGRPIKEIPDLSGRQRHALRCVRDFTRSRLVESDDRNRCDPGLAWLDTLLDGKPIEDVDDRLLDDRLLDDRLLDDRLLDDLIHYLPAGTPRTVEGVVDAVANVTLALDAHNDASTPAFDEIVKLCGLAKTWEYPAQVIRDVEDALKQRDAKIAEIREERTLDLHVMSRQGEAIEELRAKLHWSEAVIEDKKLLDKVQTNLIDELREKLRVAETVRDDARRVSALDLEQRRSALNAMREQADHYDEAVAARRGAELANGHYAELIAAQEKRLVEIVVDRDHLKEIAEACREDQRALAKRRDELLALVARLTNEVPFPDEWKDWEITRAKLVAEIGTLRSQVKFLSDDQVRLIKEREEVRAELRTEQLADKASSNAGSAFAYSVESKIRELTEQKDGAYRERARCVAALAACAVHLGWDAWLGKHDPDPKWDHDWMTIVFIELPTGQVSWHLHDGEVEWFSFLPTWIDRKWDGHDTAEKYARLTRLGGK